MIWRGGSRPQWQSRTPCEADYYPTDLERSRGTGIGHKCSAAHLVELTTIPLPTTSHLPADQPYDNHPDNHPPVHPVAVKAVQSALPSESIDAGKLTSVQDVLHKHKKLACASKVGTLAVKLAKEAYFGEVVMVQCTVAGDRGLPHYGTSAAENNIVYAVSSILESPT